MRAAMGGVSLVGVPVIAGLFGVSLRRAHRGNDRGEQCEDGEGCFHSTRRWSRRLNLTADVGIGGG